MSKRQVIILWVISLILAGSVALVKLRQQPSASNATRRSGGQTLFEAFPAATTATIEIQAANSSLTLTKKADQWVVSQRDDYPANQTFVNDLIRTLSELKVTLGMKAGPSFAARFGMDENSKIAAERGLTAIFKDSSQQEIAKVSFGKSIQNKTESSGFGSSNAVGRYIRNHADDTGFYAISEMFPALSSTPSRWLAADFISPEKIRSVRVSQPDQTATAWQLTRESEDANFTLVDAAPAEILNQTATVPLKNLFALARFEDVVPQAEIAAKKVVTGNLTVVIETFEGFIYTLTLAPMVPSTAPPQPMPDDEIPAATDNYLLTVGVSAEIPKQRKKPEDEKPEDATAADKAFAERAKALTAKLTAESRHQGRTFEVAKTLVAALLEPRAKMLTPAAPAQTSGGAGAQKFPGGLIANPPPTK
jgi:Domain of unknown function (DUF4340)